jgi:hypothetical protein
MGESVIKFVGDDASENILDEESGKVKGHGKPGMEAVMVDISDVVMSNTENEADIITLPCSKRSTKLASRPTKAGSST